MIGHLKKSFNFKTKRIIILDCSYFSTSKNHLNENLVLIRKDANKVKKKKIPYLSSIHPSIALKSGFNSLVFTVLC